MTNNVDKFKFYLIGMIDAISKEDLIYMIKNNKPILLLDYDLPPYLSFVQDLVLEHKEEILENITYENLLKYSDEFKPDMAGIIRHPKGKKWFERLLKQVRFIIRNAHLSPEAMRAKFVAIIKAEQKRRIEKDRKEQELLAQKELEKAIETEQEENELKELINPTNPKPEEKPKSEEIKEKKENANDEFGFLYNPHI